MLRATFYIMACSGKNRLQRRLQRLREPRYLLGALAGSAYLYFSFFRRSRGALYASRGGQVARASFVPLLGGVVPGLAGLAMLLAAAVSLVMPLGSGLLEFSTTESEFLFPAPVTRRQLLLYRIVRSQWAVFFSALLVSVTFPLASPSARLRGFAGAWVLLMTTHVFVTGVVLTRSRSIARTARTRWLTWAPRLAIVGGLVLIAGEVGQSLARSPVNTIDEASSLLVRICAIGLPRLVVAPFLAIVRPLFTDSFPAFVAALPGALVMYGITIVWVLGADEAFESMSEELIEKADRQPAKRAVRYRARPMAWTLALQGRPETPFVWKTATQTFRIVDRRVVFRLVFVVAWIAVVATLAGRARGLAQGLGLLSAAGAAFTVLMGPQMLRLDLRQDLQHLEVLKTWPVRAAAIVRGEIIWPALVVTCVAWTFGAVALLLSATVFTRTGLALRLAAGWAAMILAPTLVLAQYTIHSAAALIFPAWIATGGRPRGVDAMGQRLIMLGGTTLILVFAVLPGALIGGVLWIAFFRFVGPWILIPAAVIAATTVTIEVLIATEALGPAYERLDITSVERLE